jgi:ribonuclease HI
LLCADGGVGFSTDPRVTRASWGAACDLDRSREAPFTSDCVAFGSVSGRQTAQRGELQGALEGLRRLREPCASITLATDSAYLLRGLAIPGPRLRNHDLWRLLHQQVARLTAAEVPIYLLKVRSRPERRQWADLIDGAPLAIAASIGNLSADVLATEASKRLRMPAVIAAEITQGDAVSVALLRRFVAIEAHGLQHYGSHPPPRRAVARRTASMTTGPIVRFGTKWPSMTSTCT